MPDKPLRFCKANGCDEMTGATYCDAHAAEHAERQRHDDARYDVQRGTPSERGYDARWQAVRMTYLMHHPICERCRTDGRIAPATLVHHIKELGDGGARLDARNLMALCQPCHEEIHGPRRWRRRAEGGVE